MQRPRQTKKCLFSDHNSSTCRLLIGLLYQLTQRIQPQLMNDDYRPPGTVVREVFCFTRDVFFFSTRNLPAPSVDHRETSPHDRNLWQFYKLTPKIQGALPQKIGGQKHAEFRSILYNLRLWSRISPERLKISKIGKLIHRRQFLLRYMEKVRWTLVH